VEEVKGRVFVLRVTSGGPADQAGLQAGDIILTVKKSAVSGLADFYRKVWALGDAGVDVPLSILQGIRIRELTVNSGNRYQYLQLKPSPSKGLLTSGLSSNYLQSGVIRPLASLR
jgi:S1-C subfamily serine protease